jgi:hypothetical protein
MPGQDFTSTSFSTNESWIGTGNSTVFNESGNATGPIVVNGNITAVGDPATVIYGGQTIATTYKGYFLGTAGAVIYVFETSLGVEYAVGYTPQSLGSVSNGITAGVPSTPINYVVSNVGGVNEWFVSGVQTPEPSTVYASSTVTVKPGATASGFTDSGATIYISSGGTLAGETINGGTVYDSGVVLSGTALSGATVLVGAGGSALSATVGFGGTLDVTTSGFASATMVSSGGIAIASGAPDIGGSQYSNLGGGTIFSGGSLVLENGASDNGIVVSGTEIVSSGGFSEHNVILSGGSLITTSGALLDELVISSGASVAIVSGATLGPSSDDTNYSEGAVPESGGTLTMLSGSVLNSAHVEPGGVLNLYAGEVASNIYTNSGSAGATPAIINLNGATITVVSDASNDGYGVINFGSVAGGVVTQQFTTAPGGTLLDNNTISGFLGSGDTIDLATITSSAGLVSGVVGAGGIGTIYDGANTYTIDFAGVTSGTPLLFSHDAGGNLEIIGFCFLQGTRIATPAGAVAVEYLHEDDLVLTASGEAKPVRWIGYRHIVMAAELPNAHLYAPVVIKAGAIAEGKPARDLWVTPDHAILVEGRLIPAKLLINGRSIRQVPRAEYSFYHLELDQHDLLLAEGLEAESYLDVAASRQRFANAAVSDLVPDMTITEVTERAYAAHGVMPLSLRAEEVKPVWEAVAARAAALAPQAGSTSDPALHLLVAGRVVSPARVDGARYLFPVSGSPASIVIASRHSSPWAAKPWIDDRRELGVAVASVTVLFDTDLAEVPLTGAAAAAGWYAPERDEQGRAWRWTNGAGVLMLPEGEGARWIEVTLQGTMDYPIAGDEPARMAAAG